MAATALTFTSLTILAAGAAPGAAALARICITEPRGLLLRLAYVLEMPPG
jgi:hypothetical protein